MASRKVLKPYQQMKVGIHKRGRKDVLPEPLAPMIAVRLPRGMCAVMPLRIVFRRDVCWVDVSPPFLNKAFALSNGLRAE